MKKTLKSITLIVLALLVAAIAVLPLAACTQSADFTVGIIQLAPHVALDKATQGFIDGLTEEMNKAGKTVRFDLQNAQGDSATCPTIVNSFVSKNVDLIMANATAALQAAANATVKIPVLGTSVTEYGVALGINDFNGTVDGNVSGTSDLAPLAEQARMIIDLYPSAQKIGLLYCSAEPNSKYQVVAVKSILEAAGKTANLFSFSDSNDLSSVCTDAASKSDALYVPTDNTVASNTETINNVCQGKIPVFSGEEGICVGCGVVTLSISYHNIGVKTGKMAAEILLNGADISTMPVAYDDAPVKKFVKSRCEAFGITVPSDYVEIPE